MKKFFKKALNITVRTITYLAFILIFVFACAVESVGGQIAICVCLAWLGLMGVLAWLEKKYGI